MKAFVIFPTICVFVLTMTLLTLDGQTKSRTTFLWSAIVTVLFGGLKTWFSVDFFFFLYYSNFIGVLVCVPCLTYLTNRLLSKKLDKRTNWILVLGLGIISTVVTIATAGFLNLFSVDCLFVGGSIGLCMNDMNIKNPAVATVTAVDRIPLLNTAY